MDNRYSEHTIHLDVFYLHFYFAMSSQPLFIFRLTQGFCRKNRKKGLTLLELLIVVAIVGVLAAIALPYYNGYLERSRYTAVIASLQTLEKEITLFHSIHGKYPDTLGEIGFGDLKDPWGNPYKYLNIAKTKGKGKLRKDHNMVPVNTDFDLYSMGPDGKSQSPFTAKASRDDIVRANNGAFLGKVSDY